MYPLPERHLVVLDIETTEPTLALARGVFPSPVEIAGVLIDCEYNVLDEWSKLFRPSNLDEFTEVSEGLTGITRDELENAETFKEGWRELANFTKFNGYKPASWGAPFDYAVLRMAYGQAGLGWPHAYPFFDALSFAAYASMEYGFKLQGWKLKHACERFGVPVEGDHRAISGARACVSVMREIATLGD